jgi:hypothetical protein
VTHRRCIESWKWQTNEKACVIVTSKSAQFQVVDNSFDRFVPRQIEATPQSVIYPYFACVY